MKKIKEPFYKSRRIWSAGLTFIATVVIVVKPEYIGVVTPIMTTLAGILGMGSWVFPKK